MQATTPPLDSLQQYAVATQAPAAEESYTTPAPLLTLVPTSMAPATLDPTTLAPETDMPAPEPTTFAPSPEPTMEPAMYVPTLTPGVPATTPAPVTWQSTIPPVVTLSPFVRPPTTRPPVTTTRPPVVVTTRPPTRPPVVTTRPPTRPPVVTTRPPPVTTRPPTRPPVTTSAPVRVSSAGFKTIPLSDKKALQLTGKKVAPIVTKGGLQAFEVIYPAKSRGGGSTNMSIAVAPPEFFPAEEIRFQFKWWVDESFVLEPTPKQKIGGKILGFRIGKGSASGGEYSTTAATYRITFGDYGAIVPYLYFQLTRDFGRGDGTMEQKRKLMDQTPQFWQTAQLGNSGTHLWDGKHDSSYQLRVKKGQWNTIEMYIKLNTVGKYDGALELAVNGVRKRQDGVRFRTNGIKIEQLEVHPFWGGGWTTPNTTKSWFADFSFARK